MDEFSYIYEASTNKLTQVTDNNDNEVLTIDGDPVNFGDIKSGQGTDNYVYYPDGSLKSDLDACPEPSRREEIAYIDWYPSGKIKRIYRTAASEQSDLYFEYDPMGIRTLKVEMTRTGTVLNTPNLWEYSYYAGDANGTTLAIYELNVNDQDNTLFKTETMLYGGSRLGIDVDHVTVSGLSIDPTLACNTDGRASFMLQLTGPSLGQPSQDIVISLAGVELANMPNWGGGSGAISDLITLINSSGAGVEATVISAEEDAGIYTVLIEITESYAGTFAEGALIAHSVAGAYVTITTEREFTAGECYSSRDLGMKYYEITNHLGNVMEVVSDMKITVDNATFDAITGNLVSATSDGIIDYFEADVVQYSDYYPYGMTMPGRNGSISEKYRYAFNGMETDPEVSGSGNSYTTQFRQYDPRLGRWKSLDPLAAQFPWQSPFCGMDDNPIVLTDVLGLSTGNGDDPPLTGAGTQSDPYQVSTFVDRNIELDKIKSPTVGDVVYFTNGKLTSKATYNGATWDISYGSPSSDESSWTSGGYYKAEPRREFEKKVGTIPSQSDQEKLRTRVSTYPGSKETWTYLDYDRMARLGVPLSIETRNAGLEGIWDYMMDNRIYELDGIRYFYDDNGILDRAEFIPKGGAGPIEWLSGPGKVASSVKVLNGVQKFNRGSKTFYLTQGTAASGWKHIYDRHIDLVRYIGKTKFATGMTYDQLITLMSRTIKHGQMSFYEGKTIFTFRQSFNGVYKQYRITINADGTIQTFHALD